MDSFRESLPHAASLSRVAAAIGLILTCGDVSVCHALPSGYGREQSWDASANARADGCEDGCGWNDHASVYGYACGDERASLS